jgi:hypothetical protein
MVISALVKVMLRAAIAAPNIIIWISSFISASSQLGFQEFAEILNVFGVAGAEVQDNALIPRPYREYSIDAELLGILDNPCSARTFVSFVVVAYMLDDKRCVTINLVAHVAS